METACFSANVPKVVSFSVRRPILDLVLNALIVLAGVAGLFGIVSGLELATLLTLYWLPVALYPAGWFFDAQGQRGSATGSWTCHGLMPLHVLV